jgi:5,10-methenyltetrahydromethanopterin hydrogenase
MAKMTVQMMEGMLASMSLTVTADSMTTHMGDQAQTTAYKVTGTTDKGMTVVTTDEAGAEETMHASFADGVMTWMKDGKAKPISWKKK